MPIGIIIWLILIIIIDTLSNPASWIIDLTLIGISIVFISVWGLLANFTEKRADKRAQTDREKAIDEWERKWERKWGRRHPSRK